MAAATAAPYYPSPFVTSLLATLAPYFRAHTPANGEHPFTDIVRTLCDYGARTRAEMLHAAQVLAFGFSALETLKEAEANPDLTPALRIRFRACAAALHRASMRSEAALQKHLACDIPATAGQFALGPEPDPGSAAPHDAEPEEPERLAAKALLHAKATIESHRARLIPKPPQRRESPISHLFLQTEPIAAAR